MLDKYHRFPGGAHSSVKNFCTPCKSAINENYQTLALPRYFSNPTPPNRKKQNPPIINIIEFLKQQRKKTMRKTIMTQEIFQIPICTVSQKNYTL